MLVRFVESVSMTVCRRFPASRVSSVHPAVINT